MKILDYIVVGSGSSGSMVAQTLADAGVEVTMVDVGITAKKDTQVPAGKTFLDLRKNDRDQYKYTIGSTGKGIAWGEVAKGAQVTPPRRYMMESVDALIPLTSKDFSPLESLGYGGLGIGWGLQCWEYSDIDLASVGLDPSRMRDAYDIVASRIGISATRDAAADYTIGSLTQFQPSVKTDRNHRLIQSKYEKHQKSFLKKGVYVGRTPLALISKPLGDRKAYRYLETDFYSDADKSAWRPWITVDALKKRKNFTYMGNLLVVSFKEEKGIVTVKALDATTHKEVVLQCKNLILASGALGSARIALRSQGGVGTKTSILSNPHTYIPSVQPSFLGKGYEAKKLSLGQVSYFIDPTHTDAGVSIASSYSYQSLMLFRIIAQLPFNFADGRLLGRFLTPAIVIAIAQHPDSLSKNKYLKLVKDGSSPTGDKIEAHYKLSQSDEDEWNKREKSYMSLLRKLGTFPIKQVKMGHGSGIHYAGTLPFSETPEALHLTAEGRLHKTKHVYVADSSGFRYLPAKGLTFTLMANAHLVATQVLKDNGLHE